MGDRGDVWREWVERGLRELEAADLLRDLEPLEPQSAVRVRADGRELTLFSTNDYLGLSSHPRLRRTVEASVERAGMGPRGSPLICGYTETHEELEERLSELEGTESTLLFPTGFAANLGVLTALADEGTTIFSDELNHASIIDGCRLARRMGADLEVYDHADAESLERKLEASEAPRKVVVTDTVFSMEGDLAPLDAIAECKRRHDALLVVDEAHATLVFGETGAGATEHFGVGDAVDVNVGTLSKAFGSLGGFASTSESLRSWILNQGRSYIYSTAPPLPVVAASVASLEIAADEPSLRGTLFEHVERVGEALGRAPTSPIVPVVLGDETRAMEVSRELWDRGIHCTAVRPPTVPEGTSRLRVALSAAHTSSDVERLLDALRDMDVV